MPQTFDEQATRCATMLKEAKSVVLLSGAGMSTSAGIPDFRGPNGLYRTAGITDPERIFDLAEFSRNPALFYRFHRAFLSLLDTIHPTFAHRFFAALEQKNILKGIVTQNIDGLHQRAGSSHVLEIHGGVETSTCIQCSRTYPREDATKKTLETDIPRCDSCGGVLKPDIVFFSEPVRCLEECLHLVRTSDLLFVVGSSLTVTPAALLPAYAGKDIVVVNRGPLSFDYLPKRRISLLVEEDIDAFFKEVDACFSRDPENGGSRP